MTEQREVWLIQVRAQGPRGERELTPVAFLSKERAHAVAFEMHMAFSSAQAVWRQYRTRLGAAAAAELLAGLQRVLGESLALDDQVQVYVSRCPIGPDPLGAVASVEVFVEVFNLPPLEPEAPRG